MLVLEDVLNKMKIHFPRWMDIRRMNTSTGGAVLQSSSSAICNIQSAIDSYVEDFFITKYITETEEIIDFLYKGNIGITDINSIVIIDDGFVLTEDQELFLKEDGYILYQKGFLYSKLIHEDGLNIAIEKNRMNIDLAKTHIWNIYDEFAVFLGLERFQWESNKELLNRILNVNKYPINSSEDGIKNAILNTLINIDEKLSKDDIRIERATAENLKKKYKEFNSILDYLNEINKDVYKYKKWDVDSWNYEIDSVEYIPHAWDVVLYSYTNGIGFEDDLEVSLIDNSSKTNAEVNFYKKKLEAINAYVKNSNIREKTQLELKRFKHDLKSKKVKFKITATESYNIDPNLIQITAFENKVGYHKINIEDVADPFMFGVQEVDKSILDEGFDYRVDFIPNDGYEDFIIEKFFVKNQEDEKLNLINQNRHGFEQFGEFGVRNSSIKHYLEDHYQFQKVINSHKDIDGFTVSNTSKPAYLEANIDGCAGLEYKVDYDVKTVPILIHEFDLHNCYLGNGTVIADTVADEKYVNLNIKANEFSAILHGDFKITYSINKGENIVFEKNNNELYEFKIDRSDNIKNIKIKIELFNGVSQAFISDIKYSKFNITVSSTKSLNMETSGVLPDFDTNDLKVKFENFTGKDLLIKSIVIGNISEKRIPYENISFSTTDGNILETKFTGCKMVLTKLLNGEVVETIDNYNPIKHYKSEYGTAQIILLMDDFTSIDNIYCDNGSIETINYGDGFIQHSLNISTKDFVSEIIVAGTINKEISKRTLSQVLSAKGYSFLQHEFYVAKTQDNIIAVKGQDIKYVPIYKNDIFNKINMSTVQIDVGSQTIIPSYLNGKSGKNIDYVNKGNFEQLSFIPTKSKIYIAHNEMSTVFAHTKDIRIINTFNNDFDPNSTSKLYYNVESLSDEYDVRFSYKKAFELLPKCSFDNDILEVKIKDMENLEFNLETFLIDFEYQISSLVKIPDFIKLENKETLEVATCIVSNDLDIQFKDRLTDSDNVLDYEMREVLVNSESSFFKLKYSNIDRVDLVTEYKDGSNVILEEGKDYKILYEEGICILLRDSVMRSQKFYINYAIKKPVGFNLTIDELYEKVSFNVNAFEHVEKITLEQISNNQKIDLSIYDNYGEADYISVKCQEAGFVATEKNGVILFKKDINENTVAVKSGYFYQDGEEYYLFANRNDENISRLDNVYFYNVLKDNKKLYLNQRTTNNITNSKFNLSSFGEVYFLDCASADIENKNKLKSISSCNNFNYWESCSMNLEIVKGFNDSSLKFTTIDKLSGYAYLNLSDFTDNIESVLSFYLQGDCKAYLGYSKPMKSNNSEFNQKLMVEIEREILASSIDSKIFSIDLPASEYNYYLVLTGSGVVDDIIITSKEDYSIDIHTKNISSLNLDIEESVYTEYTTRLFLTSEHGSTFDGTEIKEDDSILNTSYINWGFTPIEKYRRYEDFKGFQFNNVELNSFSEQGILSTADYSGTVLTPPISLGNIKTIKNIVVKINDVIFDSMSGFKATVLTSESKHSNYREVIKEGNNMFSIAGDKLESYIKIDIEMPKNKVINNIEIYAEYLSSQTHSTSQKPTLSGSYLSKVLDTKFHERFLIKKLNVSDNNFDIKKYKFEIRAAKGNTLESVWTDWHEIKVTQNEMKEIQIENRLVFDGYRYYQFKLSLNGEGAKIKADSIDLEVI